MEQYSDQINRIIELTNTGLEALVYLSEKMNAGVANPPLYLISDVIDSFLSVKNALDVVQEQGREMGIEEMEATLESKISQAAIALEAEDIQKFQGMLDTELIPLYRLWQKKLASYVN